MTVHTHANEFSVTIRDESFPRSEIVEVLLRLSSHRLTARDLISERVRAECDQRLLDGSGRLARLIQPGKKEEALNGPGAVDKVDPDREIGRALSAFEKNGFVLLVDDLQVEALDDELEIKDETVVTFLKLTPLVGG